MAAVARKQVRGKRLVAKVLNAALAEMARVGPEGLSIEDVAARADVNKTTIYRRWPTPRVLAREALLCASEASSSPPDTGNVRDDLAAFASRFRQIASSPDMQAVIRMRFAAQAQGNLATLASDLERKKHSRSKAMWRRAVARGELRRGIDTDLLHDIVVGALLYLVVFARSRSDAARLQRAMALILEGAVAPMCPVQGREASKRRPRARRS
jgi:AcrR family transcriptional regulator